MVLFTAFGGMPQLAVMMQNRSIWFKHRASNLYNASAYAWATALVQLPLSVVESALFCIITYFMIGFSLGARPSI
jgi:ABC-type multidrug transport system permease subunit